MGLGALVSCRSPDLMSPCCFPQRDPTSYFFSRNLRRHNDGGERDVEGGGERISTDLLTASFCTVQYSSVLYSTVPYPYCTEIPFFDLFDSRLQSCLSISRARLPCAPHLKVVPCVSMKEAGDSR